MLEIFSNESQVRLIYVWLSYLSGSILSKKAAEGISHLVLDLKCGKDCWLKTVEKAEEAGHAFNTIARGLGLTCTSVITNMERPLGFYVGNALEIIETLEFLKNKQPRSKDLQDLVFTEGVKCFFKYLKNPYSRFFSAKRSLVEKTRWRTYGS